MAIPKEGSLKRPRVIEETLESEESEIESEESDVELGDDLNEIKQEVEDWNDSWDDVELERDDFVEVIEEKKEVESDENPDGDGEGVQNGVSDKEQSGDGEDNFGDVESEDEKPSEEVPKIKKKAVRTKQKKVTFADDSESSSDSESDALQEDEDDDDDDEEEGEGKEERRGLANVMSKILGGKKKDILSKATKDYDLPDKEGFQVVDEKGELKKEVKEDDSNKIGPHLKHLMRQSWLSQFRKVPTVLDDREQERKFKMIATQGVVQLFSAITKHKCLAEKEIQDSKSIVERELLLENTEKSSFMKVLQKESKKVERVIKDTEVKKEPEVKKEEDFEIPEKKPRWSALSKNFYQEPSLKGWDQESDDD